MKNLKLLVTLIFSLFFVNAAHAIEIEAEGRALIENGNIKTAREAAIKDASQQASLHAAVFVSSSQVLRDGILEIDNTEIKTLGQVTNIEVLDERIVGAFLNVRIKADVFIDTECENGVKHQYKRSIAVTAFPLQNLSHAQLGGLDSVPVVFANQMNGALSQKARLSPLLASRMNIHTDLGQAGTVQLDNGSLSTIAQSINVLDVDYVISGIIRDMSMVDPRVHKEKNFLIDQYNKLDYLSKKYLRTFVVEIYLHDGFSGELIMQKAYQTAGLWNLNQGIRTGFGTAVFEKQDYAQKIAALRQTIAKDVEERLRCEPYIARIERIEGQRIWVSAGASEGLKKGDKMTVHRLATFYTRDMQAQNHFTDTGETLTIDNVQGHIASGRITGTVQQHNIRSGDIVIAR